MVHLHDRVCVIWWWNVWALTLIFYWLMAGAGAAQASGDEKAMQLRNNVVSISTTFVAQDDRWNDQGFGFIVGERDGNAVVVTANHVVRGKHPWPDQHTEKIQVTYFGDLGNIYDAKLLRTFITQIDLAVIEVKRPKYIKWHKDVLGSSEQIHRGTEVWYIGRSGKWYVPTTPGKINDEALIGMFTIDDLSVRPGTSGAPVVSSNGILGMVITDSTGAESRAVSIDIIYDAYRRWNLPWLLTNAPFTSGQTTPVKRAGALFPALSENRNPVTEIKTVNLAPGVEMTFVNVPPGSFMMGSPSGEPGRDDVETLHKVTLTKGFYLQTTEVTQGQWQAVMGSNPSSFKDCGDDCPVERVSWDDAQEFIRKLNQKEKTDKYRLPTEAEWEYAARAGSTDAYGFGADVEKLAEYAWYDKNSNGTTHPVAQKEKNIWGLYDMHGNVWEWCADWFGDYPQGTVADPAGPHKGDFRVIRGGSWFNGARLCRSANRYGFSPENWDFILGFRLARTP